jgi:hypothetical protein
MTIRTSGTNATTSLATSLIYQPGYGSGLPTADMAAITNAIKDDISSGHPLWPGAFDSNGLLFIPNRGVLKVLPGDMVAVDSATGWPILVSAYALSNGPWTHS